MSTSQFSSWSINVLSSLNHPVPSSVQSAHECKSENPTYSNNTDVQFEQLTLWLEDRVIRQWEIEARGNLKRDFWNSINSYLQDLECPAKYLGQSGLSWRTNPKLRIRVVYWLLSCAISEVYAESENSQLQSNDSMGRQMDDKESSERLDSFQLGFTTGDLSVDRILTILRMKFLMELQKEQRRQNDTIESEVYKNLLQNPPQNSKRSKKK